MSQKRIQPNFEHSFGEKKWESSDFTISPAQSISLPLRPQAPHPRRCSLLLCACDCRNGSVGNARHPQKKQEKNSCGSHPLHQFSCNKKHFTAGLLLFLCCLSCLSCQKSFPAYKSPGSNPFGCTAVP